MLEITVDTVDGVEFIKDIRILEPDDSYLGVPFHRIQRSIPRLDAEFFRAIKAMGLRNVGPCEAYLADMYTEGHISYWRLIITRFLFRCYWAVIKWLYDNGRVFKQIPEGFPFSWSYFTPYCWYQGIKKRIL